MGSVPVDRDVADLVDDQELWLAIELQSFLDLVLAVGLRERSDERHGLGEVGPIAFGHRLDAESDRQMGFPDAWRAQEDGVLAVGDVAGTRRAP